MAFLFGLVSLGLSWVKFVIFRYFMQIMGTMSAKQPLTMLLSPIIIHKSLPTNHYPQITMCHFDGQPNR
ncbi:hypothetical protein B0682_03725 [Moraxella lincolnii]|uniref:Uncharacterized protein n=1 Tax=Lwoffella lincolnii TaxID=90241 RepID=A0A1T0CHB6_9GAMM|nr:hypothetical protein B0682_03725 [Moraxella lincolnii]